MENVTANDVVDVIEHQITDPDEVTRIWEAIDADPELSAMADLLMALEPEPEVTPEVAAVLEDMPALLRQLNDSTLGYIGPSDDLHRLATEDVTVETELQLGSTEPILITLTSSDGTITLDADWPAGVEPLGLVLGEFVVDDVKSRTFEIVLPSTQPASTLPSAEPDRAQTRKPPTLAARRPMGADPVEEPLNASESWGPRSVAEQDDGSLQFNWILPANRRSFVGQARFVSAAGERVTRPLTVKEARGGDGVAVMTADEVQDVAETVGSGTTVECLVSALTPEGITGFDAEGVSMLLGEAPSESIPILATDSKRQAFVSFASERQAIERSPTNWLIRLSETGGGR